MRRHYQIWDAPSIIPGIYLVRTNRVWHARSLMIAESESVRVDRSPERRFNGPLKLWEVIFLVGLAGGILVAACWQSRKLYLANDELLTAVLVSNPSFSEMWNVIRHGGELNPPLFFVLEWLVAHTFGTSELALRAISALSVALAGNVLFFTIRPLSGPRIAALAVAMVLGLSREVFFFSSEARYYGLLLLLVSLAAFLSLRFNQDDRPPGWRKCLMVWLVNCALVYLHLYGLLYSGAVFAAMIAADWLRRRPRWGVYAAVVCAWLAFAAWVPSMRQQLKSVSGGVFVPPGMLTLGSFLDDLQLQTPLAFVFLVVAGVGTLSLMAARPSVISQEANASVSPMGWLHLMLTAFALLAVPISTWTASHVLNPPPYIVRYMFPCIAAWVFVIGFALLAVHRLPRPNGGLSVALPPWVATWTWGGVLVFCIFFQPMRAFKNPARPAAPFVDEDFGHNDLPIVFENSWYFLQRAWYGHGRQYFMLIDHDAAEADPGWFTKNMERELRWFSPRYGNLRVVYYKDLPNWPTGFLAVDDDVTKTFEWLFSHRPELTTRLLGAHQSDPPYFGEQRIYFVHRK